MKEIVINTTYGGFGLSHKATMEYAKRKGFELYPHVDKPFDKYKEDGSIDYDACFMVSYTKVPWEEYDKIRKLESHKPVAPGRYDVSNSMYFLDRDIPRDDEVLTAIVKEIGEEANTRFCNLEVVEIPDDVEWEIEEYDGMEWITEKHRTWR